MFYYGVLLERQCYSRFGGYFVSDIINGKILATIKAIFPYKFFSILQDLLNVFFFFFLLIRATD